MAEPTIDEMLEWLSRVQVPVGKPQPNMLEAIRAILEQHKDVPRSLGEGISQGLLLMHPRDIERRELEAIRAFVERVRLAARRDSDWAAPEMDYEAALNEELAAMERE